MDTLESLRTNLEHFRKMRTELHEQMGIVEDNILAMEKLEQFYLKGGETVVNYGTYSIKSSWSSKIMFALDATKSATPQKMAKMLEEFERVFGGENNDSTHLLNIASQYLPKMFKDGLIDREKDGRAFKYKSKK